MQQIILGLIGSNPVGTAGRCCTAQSSGCATPRPSPGALGITLHFFSPSSVQRNCSSSPSTPPQRRGGWRYSPAPPLSPQALFLLPDGALAVGTGLLTLLILLMAGAFYARMFRWDSFGELLAPAVLSWSPPFSSFGAGWFLGNLRHVLLYPLIALPFLCAYLPLPRYRPSRGASSPIPGIGVLDPGFSPPAGCLVGQGWD